MGGRVAIDETGKRYGRLTVVKRDSLKGKQATWRCECDCGATLGVSGGSLRAGRTMSCGCLALEAITSHGMYKSATYCSWLHMKQRCDNPNFHQYEDYGGKGVRYTPRWKSFENFLEDMGERPEGMTLNRLQRSLLYSKETCNWATKSEQNYDKSSSRNSSGKIGVSFYKAAEKWSAEIGVNGNKIKLGLFENFEDAVKARLAAELKYFGYNKE